RQRAGRRDARDRADRMSSHAPGTGDGGAGLDPAGAGAGQGRAIGVLVSGEGTNLQALIDAGLPIVAVASNRHEARAIYRAEQAGIPTAAFPLGEFPCRETRDAMMAEWLAGHGVEL